MSWDILIQDLPADAMTFDDIPEDFEPKPIGERSDVIRKIQAVVPQSEFSDLSCGNITAQGLDIEVDLGDEAVVSSISLYVHGDADDVGIVQTIVAAVGSRAIDLQTDQVFELQGANKSFAEWRALRDSVLNRT